MKTLFLLALTLVLASCANTSVDPGAQNNNTFTPPSALYFKVDGVTSLASADAVHGTNTGFRVTKAFEFNTGERHNGAVGVNFGRNFNYLDSLANGQSVPIYVKTTSWPEFADSAQFYITMDYYPTGVYELAAASGKMMLSKVNDTLQLTTVGAITVTGLNTQPPYESQTRTVEFNLRNARSF